MRAGIDVGGTNTDAVLMDGRRVVATAKAPTTPDITQGMIAVLEQVLISSGAAAESLQAVMIGTTHFINAVVTRRELTPVAVIRIGLPASAGLPPFVDWPQELADAVCAASYLVAGGYEFDGREIATLDERELERIAAEIRARGIRAVAISSVFAPINAAMEERAAAIIRSGAPEVSLSLSSTIGRIGLLERENAAILNASLAALAARTCRSFRETLEKLNIRVPFYLTQNDGTLMNLEAATRYPVLTFSSGATNSMRGAAFLSRITDALVIDIGGTTTDVGMLRKSFPRPATGAVSFAGVRTNFRMPDLLSIGIGGGSLVRAQGSSVSVGPDSVGYRLPQQSLVFGGDTLTATDIAVAAGHASLGLPARVAHLDPRLIAEALRVIKRCIEAAADRIRPSGETVPVILVGGGSILVAGELGGSAAVHRPEHFAVANAVGAAIAQVGAEVDRVYSYEQHGRQRALEMARAEACARAVEAGATPQGVEVVELEELPLAYMPGGAVRVRVKAVGDLAGLTAAEPRAHPTGSEAA